MYCQQSQLHVYAMLAVIYACRPDYISDFQKHYFTLCGIKPFYMYLHTVIG